MNLTNAEKTFFEQGGLNYEWLGQSTVRITSKSGFTIYTDPVFLDESPPKAGLILISHHHVDHCLPEYCAAVRDEKTKIAAFHDSYVKYCVKDIKGVRTVKVGQTVEFGEINITGIEAYTKRGFHTKGKGCGFLIEFEGQRIYFSGDTSRIPEMSELKSIDAAIMAIADNAYAIDTKDIIEAVKELKPKLFIPVHYTPPDEPDPILNNFDLSTKDPRFFTRKEDPASLLPAFEGTDIKVVVLNKIGKSINGK